MSGIWTVRTVQTEHGEHFNPVFTYVDSMQKLCTNLVSDLHANGFSWHGMIVFMLTIELGRGHSVSSTMTMNPMTLSVPVRGVDFSDMINDFINMVKYDFGSLLELLRDFGHLSKCAVGCMTMELVLNSQRRFQVAMTTTGITARPPAPLPPPDTESDDDNDAPDAPDAPDTSGPGTATRRKLEHSVSVTF